MSDIEQNIDVTDNRHANLADLMLIRDGEASPMLDHVNECVFCQARLEELCVAANEVQSAMLFAAERPVPEHVWAGIENQLRSAGVSNVPIAESHGDLPMSDTARTSIWSSINTAIYTLSAAVLFTGLVSLYTSQGQHQTRIETQALQATIQGLMDNSRGLESVLQQVAAQNRTLAIADQSAVERLKWQLMLVDQRINDSELSDDMNYEQVKSLWGERVDALTELNKLYYANQVAVNDGEI